MPKPNRRQQADARRRATEAAAARRRAALRRRRIIAGTVAGLVLLSTVAGVLAATADTSAPPTTTIPTPTASTPGSAPRPSDYPAAGSPVVPAAAGATLTGPTPCPADDGSSPRTTQFAEPPPLCIEVDRFYSAVIATTAGDLRLQLNPAVSPASVNAFVVLARYGFYDGQPVDTIRPRAWFEVGGRFADGQAPSGFPIPDEPAAQGQILTPGTIAMIGDGTPGSHRGRLLVATFEDAAGADPTITPFGIMLDGTATLAAIDRAASQDGNPTQAVRVESIVVTPGPRR